MVANGGSPDLSQVFAAPVGWVGVVPLQNTWSWPPLGMLHRSKAPAGLGCSEISVPATLQTAEGNILLPGNPEKEVGFFFSKELQLIDNL